MTDPSPDLANKRSSVSTSFHRSFVVTGGGRGVGRAIAERLAQEGHVVVIERDRAALEWIKEPPWDGCVTGIIGDAADDHDLERAAALANEHAALSGWVNNAAVFLDANLHQSAGIEMMTLIASNLAPAVAGCRQAVRSFLDRSREDRASNASAAIVNVSSHQAQRAVPGALAYVTAKAAIEGLTRACAVDYAPHGIRCNAVALGSIKTERSSDHLKSLGDDARTKFLGALEQAQPLGAFGRSDDAAAVVAWLLSDQSAFVTGAVVPVDGGRAAWGFDPEARSL